MVFELVRDGCQCNSAVSWKCRCRAYDSRLKKTTSQTAGYPWISDITEQPEDKWVTVHNKDNWDNRYNQIHGMELK